VRVDALAKIMANTLPGNAAWGMPSPEASSALSPCESGPDTHRLTNLSGLTGVVGSLVASLYVVKGLRNDAT